MPVIFLSRMPGPLIRMKSNDLPMTVFNLKKTALALAALGVLLFQITPAARAYVLPGPHILELMVRNLDRSGGVRIDQRVVFFEQGPGDSAVTADETLYYNFHGDFRSDTIGPDIMRIHVVSGGDVMTIVNGRVVDTPEDLFDRYKDIFLYRARILVQDKLAGLGVDVHVSSLGRFQGKIFFVLGARYPDESVPQVWIERENFRPVRWLISGRDPLNPENFMDVRYEQWQKTGGLWYPRQIRFFRQDILVREIHVDRIRVLDGLPASLFNIRQLKKSLPDDNSMKSTLDDTPDADGFQQTSETVNQLSE